MILIPAIDLRNGKCVRLTHGQTDKETIYSGDPVETAQRWVAAGAKRLHVIDLDGAFDGMPKNFGWVLRIKEETGVAVQMGGGLRTLSAIDSVLSAGIDRVILGTLVVEGAGLVQEAFDRFKDHIMVALDTKDDRVAVHGWKDDSGFPLKDAIEIVEKLGGKEIIYTDIGRDGTLEGVNVEAVSRVMGMTKLPVIASGGVSSIEDIQKLKAINSPGVVIGKALYEGKINLPYALSIAES